MKRLILAAALASVAATGAAVAQNVPAPGEMPRAHDHKGSSHRGLLRSDGNKDGVVTRAEAVAAADARFALIDANKDARSTAEERTAVRDARRADRRMAPSARADSTASGIVTRDTFRTRALKRFDRADSNKDGRIDTAEMASMRSHRGPRHGGGRHGPGRDGAGMRGMMMADANRDGVLTQAEAMAGAQAKFQRMDANKDGRLTREEITTRRGGPDGGTRRGSDGMQRPPIPGDPR